MHVKRDEYKRVWRWNRLVGRVWALITAVNVHLCVLYLKLSTISHPLLYNCSVYISCTGSNLSTLPNKRIESSPGPTLNSPQLDMNRMKWLVAIAWAALKARQVYIISTWVVEEDNHLDRHDRKASSRDFFSKLQRAKVGFKWRSTLQRWIRRRSTCSSELASGWGEERREGKTQMEFDEPIERW